MPLWRGVVAHSGSKWLKSTKNLFTRCDFTRIFKQLSAVIQHFRFRKSQICPSLSSIKLISILFEFQHCICCCFHLIVGGIFDNWFNCAACVAALWHAWKSTRFVFAGSLASKLTRTSSMSLAIKPCSWAWFLNLAPKFASFCGIKEKLSNCNVIIK